MLKCTKFSYVSKSVFYANSMPMILVTFRSEYEYEIDYECDFSNLLFLTFFALHYHTRMYYTNLIPVVSCLTSSLFN